MPDLLELNGDIVVLLPGIIGSVLAHDRTELFGPSAGAIFRALRTRGKSVTALELAGDDPKLDDLGDKVTATRLFPDVTIVPGFWKIDGYTKVAESLIRAFNLVTGENFFPFPYDWRRHNEVAARKLQQSVHDWLKAQRQKGARDPKVILVAHSMGGLVSRHYLEVLGGWQEARALITFGTPYRGALNALSYLCNGYKQAGLDLTPLLRTLTSVYELLPIYPCVVSGSSEPVRVAEMKGLPYVDHDRAAIALAFHRKIEEAQAANKSLPGYGYRIVPLVGIEQPTLQSARWDNSKVEMLTKLDGIDNSGDGTVPRISATPIELSDDYREVYASECHGSLQNNDGLLAHIRGVLTQPKTRSVVRAGPPVSLSLRLEDVYPEKEAIEVGVKASSGRPDLEAVLQDATTNAEIFRGPVRQGGAAGQRVFFDPLEAGNYRVTIHGPDASPVTDVFLVAS